MSEEDVLLLAGQICGMASRATVDELEAAAALTGLGHCGRRMVRLVLDLRRGLVGLVVDPTTAPEGGAPATEPATEPAPLGTALDRLSLCVRTLNALRRDGIETIGDLVRRSDYELLELRNFGQMSLREVMGELAAHGHRLRRPGGGRLP